MPGRSFPRCETLLTFFFLGATLLIALKYYSISKNKSTNAHETYTFDKNATSDLPEAEMAILNQFRARVQTTILRVPRLKYDIFLVKWLQQVDFDLHKAENLLNETMQWRDKELMWTVHEEDWSDLRKDYTYHLDYEDIKGNPVLVTNIGSWDLRRATKNKERFARYFAKAFEDAVDAVDKKFEVNKITNQVVLIVDLENLDFFRSLCFNCFFAYLHIVTLTEKRYPRLFTNIFTINTPGIFNVVITLIMPLLSTRTQKTTFFLGGPEEWKPKLLEMGVRFNKTDLDLVV